MENFFSKAICILLTMFGCLLTKAQSEPQFTQYMYNGLVLNPAYAGSKEALEFNLLHRSQYVNLSSKAIATQFFGANLPLYKISSGVGLTVVNDLIGYQRSTSVSVQYAYRKPLRFGTISAGLSVGFIQTSLDGNKLRTPDGVYSGGGIDHKDDYVPSTFQNGIAPDFSAGIYLSNQKYFFGVSVNHLYSVAKFKSDKGTINFTYNRNLFVSAGYNFSVSRHFSLMPSLLLKSDFNKVQLDISATMNIYSNILAGFAFRGYEGRSIDAVAFFAGFKIKQGFRLIYSYDANISYLTKFNGGSHEISLAYIMQLKKKENKGYYYHNSRFL